MHVAPDGCRSALMSCQACRCLRLPGTFRAPHDIHRWHLNDLRASAPGGSANPYLTDGRPLNLYRDIEAGGSDSAEEAPSRDMNGCLVRCSECGAVRPYAEFARMAEEYRGPKLVPLDSAARDAWNSYPQRNEDVADTAGGDVPKLDDGEWFGDADPLEEWEYYDLIDAQPNHPHVWCRRLWAWFVSNRRLYGSCGRSPFKPRRVANMLRLLEWEGLARAQRVEMLRQLGCFSEALMIAQGECLRRLCEGHDCLVRTREAVPGKKSVAELRAEWAKEHKEMLRRYRLEVAEFERRGRGWEDRRKELESSADLAERSMRQRYNSQRWLLAASGCAFICILVGSMLRMPWWVSLAVLVGGAAAVHGLVRHYVRDWVDAKNALTAFLKEPCEKPGCAPRRPSRSFSSCSNQGSLRYTPPQEFADYKRQEVSIRLAVAVHGIGSDS